MSKNCIYLKQKLNRKLYCKKLKKDILISQCSNCKYKEYKTQQYNSLLNKAQRSKKVHNKIRNTVQIKKKTNKLAKMEHNRFSILTNDLNHCVICGMKKDNLHEVFAGRNRLNSIKYGLVIPLCIEHHREIHRSKELQDIYHKKGQAAFNSTYPDLDFLDIFKRNYL